VIIWERNKIDASMKGPARLGNLALRGKSYRKQRASVRMKVKKKGTKGERA